MRRPRHLALALLAGCSLALPACAGEDDEAQQAQTTPAPASNPQVRVSNAEDLTAKPRVEVPRDAEPPTSLRRTDLVAGDGRAVRVGDRITVQYVGLSWSTGEQFDASWDNGQPFQLTLGAGQVIPGWDRGLAGMRVGGRRLLVIPPQLGYGPQGQGPIAANETLVFVIDLRRAGV
ncbi:MAG: FKBP-type peptidyl-prolyl cis-trans isomerase [Solirubrobacterales bacterium]|nr:FKBP-type peptidyl-prolyl cis-trans isomerase [Solirubrobacterales bacterium]